MDFEDNYLGIDIFIGYKTEGHNKQRGILHRATGEFESFDTIESLTQRLTNHDMHEKNGTFDLIPKSDSKPEYKTIQITNIKDTMAGHIKFDIAEGNKISVIPQNDNKTSAVYSPLSIAEIDKVCEEFSKRNEGTPLFYNLDEQLIHTIPEHGLINKQEYFGQEKQDGPRKQTYVNISGISMGELYDILKDTNL
ncbi:MAG: hypothetical protein ACOCU6_00020 [Nanoarchaeota archaeon]